MITIDISHKDFRKLAKEDYKKWYEENKKDFNTILYCKAKQYKIEIKWLFDDLVKTFDYKITKEQFKILLDKEIKEEGLNYEI